MQNFIVIQLNDFLMLYVRHLRAGLALWYDTLAVNMVRWCVFVCVSLNPFLIIECWNLFICWKREEVGNWQDQITCEIPWIL